MLQWTNVGWWRLDCTVHYWHCGRCDACEMFFMSSVYVDVCVCVCMSSIPLPLQLAHLHLYDNLLEGTLPKLWSNLVNVSHCF